MVFLIEGLLEENKQGAVRVCLNHLTCVLRACTKKRPDQLPTLVKPPDDKEKLRKVVSEQVAKILVKKGLEDISDYDLTCLVYKVSIVNCIT